MFSLATLMCSSILLAAPAAETSRMPTIAFEKYTLPNGLDVILHEDHSAPIVGVNVWYHAGSKNERPGRTGFAHLFEHMMFQGSQHHDKSYFGPLQQAGGKLNGSTNSDRTNYWETVPSNYLELALWLESDRMGFLLPAMTQPKLDNQRDVVKNERRQSYENRPYGLVAETILAAMYPPDHPYSWPTIGAMTDLNQASREDIADFFRRYYHPSNASLCIAGDFKPQEVKRLVAKYFGDLARRAQGRAAETLDAGTEGGEAGPHDRPRRPLAALHRLAFGAAVRRRRGRAGRARRTCWPATRPRGSITPWSTRSRSPRTCRLCRTARRSPACSWWCRGQAGPQPGRIGGGGPGRNRPPQERSPGDGRGGRPGRQFVRVPFHQVAGADQRIRRPRRPIQRLQRLYRRSRLLEQGFRPLRKGRSGGRDAGGQEVLGAGPSGGGSDARAENRPSFPTCWPRPGRPGADGQGDSRGAGAGGRTRRQRFRPQRDAPARGRAEIPVAADPSRPALQRHGSAAGREARVAAGEPAPGLSRRAARRTRPPSRACAPDDRRLGRRHGAAAPPSKSPTSSAGIGASLSLGTDSDTTTARLFTLKRQLGKALEIFADVLRNPTFPQAELNRQRAVRLARLTQVRDEPLAAGQHGRRPTALRSGSSLRPAVSAPTPRRCGASAARTSSSSIARTFVRKEPA